MVPQPKLTMGKGARVAILIRYLHPKKFISERFMNPQPNQKLENCTVICQEVKKVSGKQQLTIIVIHDKLKTNDQHVEMHVVPWWGHIMAEGLPDFFFTARVAGGDDAVEAPVEDVFLPPDVLDIAQRGIVDNINLVDLQDLINVDDDNLPVPENMPQETTTVNNAIYGEWGHSGVCERKALRLKASYAVVAIKNFHGMSFQQICNFLSSSFPWIL